MDETSRKIHAGRGKKLTTLQVLVPLVVPTVRGRDGRTPRMHTPPRRTHRKHTIKPRGLVPAVMGVFVRVDVN